MTSVVSPGLQAAVPHSLIGPIPSLLSMPTRNHMDITIPPLPVVAPEVLRVAEHRHKKGLMYPSIYHVLTKVSGFGSSSLSLMFGMKLLLGFFFKNVYILRNHKYSLFSSQD